MSYRKRIIGSFIFATLVLFAVALAVYGSFSQMNHQKKQVEHTFEVISTLQSIMSDLKDVQSSVRGYVITGGEDYLTPYYVSAPHAQDQLVNLQSMISDNPAQVKRLTSLNSHIIERIKIAERIKDAYKEGGQEQAFGMIRKGAGKHEMDEIRIIIADMISAEQHLLNVRRQAVDTSSRLTVSAGITGVIICFLVLMSVFYLINREANIREQTENELKDAFASVETINRETQIISKMGDYLRSCHTNEEAYEMIRRNVPHLFPDTFGGVFVFNSARNLLQNVADWGDQKDELKDFEPEDCWALRQGRVHESLEDSIQPVCPHIHELGDAAAICIPMQAHGETFGQIFVSADKGLIMSAHRKMTLRTVAEQVSLALANLSLQNALREQSIRDPLTQLFNRRYLEETLGREYSRTKRNKQNLALLIMDIDFFKKVNDTYGHDAGDAVLVAFSRMLNQKVRKEDIACRLGGEEFVLVLPDASLDLAMQRAADINKTTKELQIIHAQQTIAITVSIGIAIMPQHGETPEVVLHNADVALYKAKKGGRDQFVVHDGA